MTRFSISPSGSTSYHVPASLGGSTIVDPDVWVAVLVLSCVVGVSCDPSVDEGRGGGSSVHPEDAETAEWEEELFILVPGDKNPGRPSPPWGYRGLMASFHFSPAISADCRRAFLKLVCRLRGRASKRPGPPSSGRLGGGMDRRDGLPGMEGIGMGRPFGREGMPGMGKPSFWRRGTAWSSYAPEMVRSLDVSKVRTEEVP
jgi:hypothetical protein